MANKKYPDCPEGTVPFTRRNRSNPRKRDTGCRKGEWLSANKCADRMDNDITVTGDPVLEQRIIENIDKAADYCYKAKLDAGGKVIKDKRGDIVYERDSKGRPVKTDAGLFFCRENTGRPRSIMPQFENTFEDDVNRRGTSFRAFMDMLLDKGVKIREDYVEVCKLKATQKSLDGDKVRRKLNTLQMIEGKLDDFKVKEYRKIRQDIEGKTRDEILAKYDKYLKSGVFNASDTKEDIVDKLVKAMSIEYFNYATEMGRPLVVSREGYILDGHHRWAALLAWDFKDKKDVAVKIHVKIVGLGIKDLLREAKAFISKNKGK